MRLELEVEALERGKITGINDHKVVVQAADEQAGTTLVYWTTVDEAPRVGAKLVVTVGGVDE